MNRIVRDLGSLSFSCLIVPVDGLGSSRAFRRGRKDPVSCELPLAAVQTGVRIIIPPSKENWNIFVPIGFSP